jgi:predicted DNA-binding mobile mystery protein A
MSGVKEAAARQYGRLVDRAAEQVAGLQAPKEGWIAVMRKALGMSAPQLARRLGVTKPAVYQAERMERDGGITLKHMERLAEALGGRFVYAILPEDSVEEVLRTQATGKAESIVRRAGAHMALEKQSLSARQMDEEIERLAEKLLKERPSDFWDSR